VNDIQIGKKQQAIVYKMELRSENLTNQSNRRLICFMIGKTEIPDCNLGLTSYKNSSSTEVECYQIVSCKLTKQDCNSFSDQKHTEQNKAETVDTKVAYNFNFFLDAFQGQSHFALAQETKSLIFTLKIFFQQLELAFGIDMKLFCPFLHSVLEHLLEPFPEVYIHALGTHAFIAYYGENEVRHMMFRQDLDGKYEAMCVKLKDLSTISFMTEMGFSVSMNMSSGSQLDLRVKYDYKPCLQSFPTLLKACSHQSKLSKHMIEFSIHAYAKHWKNSLLSMRSYLLGQCVREVQKQSMS